MTTVNINQSSDPSYDELYKGNVLQLPAFDAASTDYTQSKHAAYIADADIYALAELQLIQARSRDMARNNSIAYAAETKYVTKLGAVEVKWKTADGEIHELAQELWDEFAKNPNKDGKGNLAVTQSLWNHDRFQSGEAICRMLLVTKGNNNRVKLKLQNIESEYLDITYMGQSDSNTVALPFGSTRYGITFEEGVPIYYNFLPERRYGVQQVGDENFKYVQVPAEDILHIFERRRSNQWRGIPIIAPMLSELYRVTDLSKFTVDKQIAASAISWIVEQANAFDINGIGSVRTAGTNSENDTKTKLVMTTNAGSVQYTNPGDKFHLVQSADIGNNLIGLLKHELQKISSAYGIPYYMLSGDTSGLDFSSIRGILIEFRGYLEYIHQIINLPEGLDKVTARFKDVARFSFAIDDAISSYQFPRQYGVDEIKDTQADLLELQIGATTLEAIQAERNVTMEDVIASRAKMQANGLGDILLSATAAGQNKNVAANANSTGG
jgi:lambda family phage portal protein